MRCHPIEKNSIQETLVIPLYGRALCTRKFPQLFADQTAAELLEQIDYDFSALEQRSGGLLQTFGALEVAMRQSDLAFEVREYLRAHPRAAVVNLGCGLDSTGRACDNGQCSLPPACFTTFGQSRCAPSARPWQSDFRVGDWYLTPLGRQR